MKTSTKILLGFAIVLPILAFVVGFHDGRKRAISLMKPQVDTLVIRDTERIISPVFDTCWIDRMQYVEVPVWDTIQIHHHDTSYISLPMMVREYRDTNYYARISGYQPNLDFIETYSTNRVITQTIVRQVPTKWGVGLSAGYGITYAGQFHASPYVGISLNYNLFSW